MIRNPINVAFGQAVAERRQELKLTQTALAGLSGMSRASIANIEKGRQNVLLHHIYDLADALEMPKVGDILPARPRASSESLKFSITRGALSDDDTAQINNLVASVLAAHTSGGKR